MIPYPGMDFTAFDILPAVELDKLVANIESLAAGTGFNSNVINSGDIDWSAATGKIWWEELGRTTLSSNSDTIIVSSLPIRKYLRIIYSFLNSGTIAAQLTFNNDSAGNYGYQLVTNGAAAAGGNSSSLFPEITSPAPMFGVLDIINIQNREKLVLGSVIGGDTGAGTAPSVRTGQGKWANTTSEITSVKFFNSSTGDYISGSEAIVLGHN